MQLWRPASPKICRVSQQAGGPGAPLGSFQSKSHGLRTQEEPMFLFESEGRKKPTVPA